MKNALNNSNCLRQAANKILAQIFVIASLALILGVFLVGRFLQGIFLSGQFLFGKAKAACSCFAGISFSNHPWILSLLLVGGILLVAGLAFALIKISRVYRRTSRFIQLRLKGEKIKLSAKITEIAKRLNLSAARLVEIRAAEPLVFCYGFWRPRICVSNALTARLTEAELCAVLRHEQFHLKSREPLKLFLVKILSAILFFIPGLPSLAKKYLAFSELAADEYATDGFTDKFTLAAALNKMIGWEQKHFLSQIFALSFFSSATAERVRKLTDDSYSPSVSWFDKKILAGLAAGLILFFIGNNALAADKLAKAYSVHAHSSVCAAQPTVASPAEQCVSKAGGDSCALRYNLSLASNPVCR